MSETHSTGKVFLIGAGPGDPGLITLKGVECIRAAQVVVYDYLAGKELLGYAPAGAELIYAGKKGGTHAMNQEDINDLLVAKGLAGKTVARLKGGDSFIFGRGGEEALALRRARVPFEVIPGVSSAYAVPACAGIPVTHRGVAADVAFITGHEDPAKPESMIKWDKISTGVGTLVFLMGVKNLSLIVENLIRSGRSPETPVALIRWGTTPRQETITGNLSNIVDQARERGFQAPAITVVGEVVKLREELRWFEDRPLFGRRVVVTRSRAQASVLTQALAAAGAEPVEFPTIKVVPPAGGYADLDAAIGGLKGKAAPAYDWIIFTSVNGVDHFFTRFDLVADVRDLKGIKLGAIGPATAASLRERGLKPDFVPPEYRAESIVDGLLGLGIKGKRVLIPRAKEAREVLPESLAAAGARVKVVTAYETVRDDGGADRMRRMIASGEIDIITFTSSSTVRNFAAILNGMDLAGIPASVIIACIGPVTAETARGLGLRVDIVAEKFTIPGLMEAVVKAAAAGSGHN